MDFEAPRYTLTTNECATPFGAGHGATLAPCAAGMRGRLLRIRRRQSFENGPGEELSKRLPFFSIQNCSREKSNFSSSTISKIRKQKAESSAHLYLSQTACNFSQ